MSEKPRRVECPGCGCRIKPNDYNSNEQMCRCDAPTCEVHMFQMQKRELTN